MPLSSEFYNVTITNDVSNASPADGFIDNLTIQQYDLNFETTPMGLTYELCQAKRRGNLRYREIINQLHLVTNCFVPPATITSDATPVAEASTFSLQLWVERGGSLVTADELNPGEWLSGADCITRCVARALIADLFVEIDVVDPTSTQSVPNTTTSVPRFGPRIEKASDFEVGAYADDLVTAEALVAVTQLYPPS